MGGGGGGWNPVSAITDPISRAIGTDGSGGGVLGELAKIDPGPSISKIGTEIDKGVNNVVPGGWTTVAAVAAYIAMPYASAYLAAEGATLGAAEFAAYDMANLAAQGISESQMVQIGVASGMDVMAAADMASLASQGLSAAQIAETMNASYAAGEIFTSEAIPIAQTGSSVAAEMPTEELNQLKPIPENAPVPSQTPNAAPELPNDPAGITNPANPRPITQNGIQPNITTNANGVRVVDYSQQADAATQQMANARDAMPWYQRAAENMSAVTPGWDTAGKVAAGYMLAPTVLNAFGLGPQDQTQTQQLSAIPPTNWNSTNKLVDPGVNPGWINPTEVYQQTNPTDAKFYWGQHPYMATESDLPHYNAIANLPVTPWGHHEQTKPLDVDQFTQTLLGGPYSGNQNMPATPIAPTA